MALDRTAPQGRPGRKRALHPSRRQSLGSLGERLAEARLASLGYEIVARNQRNAEGEIDLVTRLRDMWVFVEVRARRGLKFGTPEESITPRKRERLLRTAMAYLSDRELGDAAWRVDVVAVEFSAHGELLRVEVIENAVNGQER
jgi:putative endonuclease